MAEEIKQGMTRREVLKKGAVVGGTMGAVMWMAPAVRALDTTSAAAAIPSEGTCCLRLVSLVAFPTSGGSGDDFTIKLTSRNCGPNTDWIVRATLDRFKKDGSGVFQLDASLDDFNVGDLFSGGETTDDYTEVDLALGTYKYRSHGTYECPEKDGVRLDHNVPGSYYVWSNEITVI